MSISQKDSGLISSTDVKDTAVYDRAGNRIGVIDHLMIERHSGVVRYAVTSFGGLLSIGESHYPLPWPSLEYDTALGGYVTEVNERQLRDTPEMSDDSWNSSAWHERVYQHYGNPTDWLDAASASRRGKSTSFNLLSTESVEGLNVYDRNDNHIGDVDHLMIEKTSGQVRYAVLSFGGFLGLGESYYPVPWASLSYDTGLEGYRTNITEQDLRDSPQFSDDSWFRRDWEERIHNHYGAPGYWDEKLVEGMSESARRSPGRRSA